MDYKLGWLIPDEVIYCVQLQDWNLDVAAQFVRDASALMNNTHKSRVPIVVKTDIRSRHYYAFQVNKMFKANKTDKWGATIIIANEDENPFVVRVMLRLAQIDLHFTQQLEGALQILYHIDPSLADKPIILPPV